MAANLNNSLLITVLGMGLVFGVILLLWAMIALVVRSSAALELRLKTGPADQAAEAEKARKRLAAAAAVALAFAEVAQARAKAQQSPTEYHQEQHRFPLPPTAVVSPWQAVMRAKILSKRGPVR
jgi:Na+-transporting methylmalonyl-CoA/oxaloacetate decarboxylase gamma subunit